MKSIQRAKLNTVAAALLSLTLAACSQSGGPGSRSPLAAAPTEVTVSSLLEQARTSPSPQAEQHLIAASRLLLQQDKPFDAQRLLSSISSARLDPDTLAELVMAQADIFVALDQPQSAQEVLTTDRMGVITASNSMTADRLNQLSLKRAQVWELTGNNLEAARERIFVAPMLSDELAQSNQQRIWNDLMAIPNEELEGLASKESTPEVRGWLELAWVYKGYQDNLDLQLKQLNRWQQSYPNHAAALNSPEAIRVLHELTENQPQHIALLLPMQGKYRLAAKAILDGFMGAYYAARDKGNAAASSATIRLYDSSDINQFQAIYQQAVTDGADIVIGPLQKENLRALLNNTEALPVTTIALNQEQGQYESPSNLYQFALSPEDDAVAVAHYATQKQFQRAAVLFQNNPWWERAYLAFSQEWMAEGNQVTGVGSYDDQGKLAGAIKDMLLVQTSEARASTLRAVLGKKIEFQPRRRQDIDFIYLIATPEQARQIRPLLDFYYAESIPVIAGSQIYSGQPNPKNDRDLNGIEFCDIPWLLDKPSAIHKTMTAAWPEGDQRFFRLNAMGVDAYRLQSRLRLLTQIPDAGLFGATGNLAIGLDNKVHRQLTWAVMKNGTPDVLPKLVEPQPTKDTPTPVGMQDATDHAHTKKAERQPG